MDNPSKAEDRLARLVKSSMKNHLTNVRIIEDFLKAGLTISSLKAMTILYE